MNQLTETGAIYPLSIIGAACVVGFVYGAVLMLFGRGEKCIAGMALVGMAALVGNVIIRGGWIGMVAP